MKIRELLYPVAFAVVAGAAVALATWMSPLAKPHVDRVVDAARTPLRDDFREVRWNDLVPKGWDPYRRIAGAESSGIADSDARAITLLDEMRAAWDDAPTVEALDGAAIRIPGYLVPLDEEHGRLREFLLVPYFGACIHTPPPPANQIVHVRLKAPVEGYRTMETIWVAGTLHRARQESFMGTSGYDMAGERIERYVVPGR